MIKPIKIQSIFLIIALFSAISVNTMEQKTLHSTGGAKHKSHNISLEDKIASIQKGLQDCVKTLLGISRIQSEYVQRLQFIANLLFFQAFIINELKALSVHSKHLVDTASRNPTRCFSIDGELLCGCGKGNECEIAKPLLTTLAQEIARELIGNMLFGEGFWDNSQLINNCYSESCKLINHKNEEISAIAKFVKNRISIHWLYYRSNMLRQCIVSALSNLEFETRDRFDETEKLMKDKQGLSKIMAKKLISKRIFLIFTQLMPDLMDIVDKAWAIIKVINRIKVKNNFMELPFAYAIDDPLNIIIRSYEQLELFHEESYRIILYGLHDTLDKHKIVNPLYTSCFLAPFYRLPESLEKIQLLNCGFKDCTEQERLDSFIAEFLLDNNKKPVKTPKKKKKSRRRRRKRSRDEEQETGFESEQQVENRAIDFNNHSKLLLNFSGKNEEKETESNSGQWSSGGDKDSNESATDYAIASETGYRQKEDLSDYSQRLLNWFKRAQFSRRTRSMLYHTYSPLADYFIEKYGPEVTQLNRTTGLMDKAYYMSGQIDHKNGEIETVVFGICFGEDGLCYHRGFDKCQDSNLTKEFAASKYNFDFPDLSTEQVIKRKHFIRCSKDICKDTCVESESSIEIKDSKNHVVITLFKPA